MTVLIYIYNAHFYAAFRMIEEEVIESGDSLIKQLFVEVFKDKDTFVENMVDNLNKVNEVEIEMTGGVKFAVNNFQLSKSLTITVRIT